MTVTTLLDPPSAVAVARCLIARLWPLSSIGAAVDADHPRPCAWEDWSRDDLHAMLDAFHEQAGYDPRYGWADPAVQRFRAMTAHEQRQLVRAAQYPETEAPR